jgi:hypothetical protein
MNTLSIRCASRSYCKRAPKFLGLYAHNLHRMDNDFVLSEELEKGAVKTLVSIAIKGLFPESCDKWRTANRDIRARCRQDFAKKENTVRQEIARGENLLRHTLHEAVIKDVIELFPYDSVTSRQRPLLIRLVIVGHWNVTASLSIREPVMT